MSVREERLTPAHLAAIIELCKDPGGLYTFSLETTQELAEGLLRVHEALDRFDPADEVMQSIKHIVLRALDVR